MSTSINNPEFLSSNEAPTAQGFTPTNQLIDDTDFPHSGLFKVLSLAVAGGYAIEGFNATAVSNTSITVAEGKIFRDGLMHQVDYSNATTTTLTIPATVNRYHLLVNPSASPNTLAIRQATADNQIPNYTAGDVIIAVLKGGTTPMQIQYLTFNQETKSISIGTQYTGGNAGPFRELLQIAQDDSNDPQDVKIQLKNTHPTTGNGADLTFRNAAGDQLLLIDGHRNGVRVGGSGNDVNREFEVHGVGANTALSPSILIQNENTHAESSRIEFFRNDTGLSNGDSIADITFGARDNSNGSYIYSRMEGVITDRTATQGDGRLVLYAVRAGAEAEFIRIDGISGITFNEDHVNMDFTVKSDNQAAMLFVDGGEDRVGIGTGTPAETLDVVGTVKASVAIKSLATIQSPQLEVVPSNNASLTLTKATHAGRYLMYSGSSGTITLPATSTSGEHYTILNLTNGNITVAHGGNNINGAGNNITVGTFNGVTCISTSSNDWIALGV